jgi:hypothetical protein
MANMLLIIVRHLTPPDCCTSELIEYKGTKAPELYLDMKGIHFSCFNFWRKFVYSVISDLDNRTSKLGLDRQI